MRIVRTTLPAASIALALTLGSAGCAMRGARYERPAPTCQCSKMMGGKCLCNHCAGEAGAKCYCGSGECGCGLLMPRCQCGHCTGIRGETECPCGSSGRRHGS